MKRAKRFLIISGFIFSVFAITAGGQIVSTMYFMPGVPQSNRINPSIQPGCSFYLGMPALAPFRAQVTSSSFGFNDVIFTNPEDPGEKITALYSQATQQEFLNKLKSVNYFITDFGVSLASIGKKVGRNFFTFDINLRADGNISYPKGLFELPINGIEDQKTLSFDGFGADVSAFNEIGLGWSRNNFIIKNLSIGVRGKALFGLANVSTRNSELNLTSNISEQEIFLHSDMEFALSSAPILFDLENYEVDLANFVLPPFGYESLDLSNLAGLPAEIFDKLFVKNFGLAADIGISYRPIPELLISASMIDIGYINWSNSVNGSFKLDYNFPGLEIDPFSEFDITTVVDELIDSVSNFFLITQGEAYLARLNSKLFIGASYYPIEKIGFGLLSRTDFLSQSVSQQVTGSVNMTTGKMFNLSLSYSYMQRTFNNVGAGLALNLGPLNMYLISDNILSAGLRPLDTRSLNLWYGMNLTFGWKRIKNSKDKSGRGPALPEQVKEKKVDMPLIL